MIIQFDPKTMHVQVICGTLEKYEPNDNILTIQKKVEELKAVMAKFRDETLNPSLDEINRLVEVENSKFIPKKPQTPKPE